MNKELSLYILLHVITLSGQLITINDTATTEEGEGAEYLIIGDEAKQYMHVQYALLLWNKLLVLVFCITLPQLSLCYPVRIAYAKLQTSQPTQLTLPPCLMVVTLPLASVSWWEETFLLAPPLSYYLPPPQLTQQMSPCCPSLFSFLEAASSQSRL